MLTLDSSITMAWVFEDEWSPLAQSVYDRLRGGFAHVPTIWPFEVGNSLLVGERRHRLSQADVVRFMAVLQGLPIVIDVEAGLDMVFGPVSALAREHGLTVYDACYLELALRRGVPLATLDRRLRQAAARVGVPVVEVETDGLAP